ncbi:MAG: ABC transporter permease [Clostridiaceae bacterium]|nr:ABC transporter permease [Clostridiaceae bacterium]
MKLWALVVKDIKLSAKSNYTYIVLVFVIVFVVVAVFFVPDEFTNDPEVFVHAGTEGLLSGKIEKALDVDEVVFYGSRDEVISNMKKDRTSIGVDITTENGKMVIEFITQGYESERLKKILEAHVMGWAALETGYEPNSYVTVLESNNPDIPANKGMLPVFLVMESAFMGFFMIAAYVFQDKEEGTIKAYAVTPAKIWQYLLSKVLVFVLFGWVSGLLATIIIMGPGIRYLQFMLLLTSASIFGSMLGLIAAGLFTSFTKAMNVIFVVAFVLGITVIPYYMPSFSPVYIRILPTYPLLFAFREVLFPTGNTVLVYTNVLGYLAASAVLFYIANKLFEKKLV